MLIIQHVKDVYELRESVVENSKLLITWLC